MWTDYTVKEKMTGFKESDMWGCERLSYVTKRVDIPHQDNSYHMSNPGNLRQQQAIVSGGQSLWLRTSQGCCCCLTS